MHFKKLFPFILFLLISFSAKAQGICSCSNGEMTFYSKAPVEDIEAVSKNLNSVLNTSTGEIVFIIPVTSFKFKKALMQDHFNEKYMESEKYPNATYKGKINEKIDFTKDGEYEITSTGILNVHNTEQPRTDKGRLVIKSGNISMHGEFEISLKDHNIKIPKILFDNIAETVQLNFSANYNPYKKEN